MQEIETKLDDLQDRIQLLKTKAEAKGIEARIELRKKIDEMKGETVELRQKLDAWRQNGQSAWDEMKVGLNEAAGKIEKAYERAKAELARPQTSA
jgi:chromosome segregation ATPase